MDVLFEMKRGLGPGEEMVNLNYQIKNVFGHMLKTRNYVQERPTQIYANCVLYTVGRM